MTTVDPYPSMVYAHTEVVFSIISQNSGKLTFKELFSIASEKGGMTRVGLYRTIALLTKEGRIKRVKGIGKNGIDYFYHDSNFRKQKIQHREAA